MLGLSVLFYFSTHREKKQIFALPASKAKLNEKQMLSTMTVSFHPSLDDFYPLPTAEMEAKFGRAASW